MWNRKLTPGFRPRAEAKDEKKLTIPKNRNATTVLVRDQTWVAIYRGDEEIMRDESPGGTINFQLPPGDYVVRTDGKIVKTTFEMVERVVFPGLPADTVSALDKALLEGKPIGPPVTLGAMAPTPKLSDLPPDILKRVLRFVEVKGQPGMDQETVDRIIETGKLPDHVSLPPDFLARLFGSSGDFAPPVPPPAEAPTEPEVDLDSLPVVLEVRVEAPGRNPVDGVAEVPADGETFCTITLSKMTTPGQVLDRAKDNDEIYLRTTGGRLMDGKGRPLRKLQLLKGKASFRLVSEAAPRVVTVSILSATLQKVDIQVDFVLPD